MTSNLVRLAYAEMEADLDRRCPQPQDSCLYLARAVLAQACEEWRRGSYLYATHGQWLSENPRDELRDWFNSPDYDWWCDMADVDPNFVRKCNNVEVGK